MIEHDEDSEPPVPPEAAVLADWLRRAGSVVGLQPEDILEPTPGLIVLDRTGVSVQHSLHPRPCWNVRERYVVPGEDGMHRPVSRLVATVDEADLVRVLRVALILAFERSLDIEISML